MKHIKIILTLTIVVLIASVMVFFVEGWTTPIINDENLRLANLAKFEVLPELTTTDELEFDESYDFSSSTISGIIVNAGIGYIYTAEFQGYSSIVEYMIGIDSSGNLSGFKVLTQGESPGYGDTITEENYRLQFVGLSFADAIDGSIDDVSGLSGAPVTMGAFRQSLKELIEYHQSNFTDVVVESLEEKLARWRDEITVTDATFTDVSDSYSMNETIVKMETANDVAVLYTVNFSGFVSDGYVEYLISFDLETNDIIGLRITHNDETSGIGSIISDESFTSQFDDMLQADALSGDIDEVAGGSAPYTYGGFRDSLEEVVMFHQSIYQVVARPEPVVVTDEDLLLAFPEGITFSSIYLDNEINEYIGNIYEVYDAEDLLLGYIYYAEFSGFSGDNDIKFVLGIDALGNTKLIEVLDSSETWNDAEQYSNYDGLSGYFPDVVWLDSFEGISILELIIDPVDEIAGVSTTTGNMLETIQDLLQYHIIEIAGGGN